MTNKHKKVVLLLILVCCMLCVLCACGKSEEVKNVETLIIAIDDVTLESGDEINKAEEAYNLLTDKDKKKVENHNILMDAKTKYEELVFEEAERKHNMAKLIYDQMLMLINDGKHKESYEYWEANNENGYLIFSDYEGLSDCYYYAKAMSLYDNKTEFIPGELVTIYDYFCKVESSFLQTSEYVANLEGSLLKVIGTHTNRGTYLAGYRNDMQIIISDDDAAVVLITYKNGKEIDKWATKYNPVCVVEENKVVKIKFYNKLDKKLAYTFSVDGNTLIDEESNIKYY